jgi:hypothetical protein
MAEYMYGDAPSMRSSAPEGTLAFAETLRRLGYDVRVHRGITPPERGVLVLLEPRISLAAEEAQALVRWVRGGGRLIYAPPAAASSSPGRSADGGIPSPPEAGARNGGADAAPDGDATPSAGASSPPDAGADPAQPLVRRIDAQGEQLRQVGSATLWRVGKGRVAVLPDGSDPLQNRNLQQDGLRSELPWLRRVIEGKRRVAFDEARLGLESSEGLLTLILKSRFAGAFALAAVALGIWLFARGVRRQPAHALPPKGGRVFGEHLRAVAGVLQRGGRMHLAAESLLEGTHRRLGPRVRSPEIREELARIERMLERPGVADLVRGAEALRRLEQQA